MSPTFDVDADDASGDIIEQPVVSYHYFTDARIDESYNRTPLEPNWLVYEGISHIGFYN